MVKSPSCFKIITCGSDSAQKDDLELTEGKGPNDKRGWSFRKRAARHRVLSNTVALETPTPGNKEGSESSTVSFEAQAETTVPEKIAVVHCNAEKPQLATFLKQEVHGTVVKEELPEVMVAKTEEPDSTAKELSASEATQDVAQAVPRELPDGLAPLENKHVADAKIEESVVILIQTAARGFLARRELLKLRKVVKLQAAVRGHIVRSHAVGTLRCVQAIVKMQALVRARHARLSLDRCQMSDAKEEDLVNKSSGSNSGVEKLLANRFARQMLESIPKTKTIHVKCDSTKPDSAWKWLERWMAVSSANAADSNKVTSVTEEQAKEEDGKFDAVSETKIESEIVCELADSKCSTVHESVAPSESEDSLITYEADKFDFQTCQYSTVSAAENSEQPEFENTSTSDVRDTSEDIISLPNKDIPSHVASEIEHKSIGGEPQMDAEKESDTSFLAAQSKFEEISSAINSDTTISSAVKQTTEESHRDAISPEAQSEISTKEISVSESPVHGSRIQVGGSECGTELSVTSTLDSPDRSDIVVMEHEPEATVLDLAQKDAPAEVETETGKESRLLPAIADQQEKIEAVNGESVAPVVSTLELTPETPDVQREHKSEAFVQAHMPSPEASPMSHRTIPESQGTPSSQASVKDSKKKSDRSGSGKKRASLSAIKKSPSNSTNNDSGSRSSVEKQAKEQKNSKKRNSLGTTKPENGEQEPRDSSSSSNNNSLPHFMQATESARAKLNPNSSPRSSPDVQDGDNYLRKRHSLPGENGRQGSPRIQRSMSQAQQGAAKGNERKWQR